MHALYLTTGGDLYGAGYNYYYQLGIPSSNINQVDNATLISQGVTLVGSGYFHSFFLNSSGLFGMGLNSDFQLCLNISSDSSNVETPTLIGITETLKYVTGGAFHSVFLTATGDVLVCGNSTVSHTATIISILLSSIIFLFCHRTDNLDLVIEPCNQSQ